MKEISYKLTADIIVHARGGKTVVFEMVSDDLFSLDGDLALILVFLNQNRSKKSAVSMETIKKHLLAESPIFRQNPFPDEAIAAALKLFLELKIIEHAN